ncbi:MAG: alpha-L-rhamnosidase C-terminal domain-containing protein [Ignavibacteriaceae bacterium]
MNSSALNNFNLTYMKILFVLLVFFSTIPVFSQEMNKINHDILYKTWNAKWITCPGISGKEYGVYLFRKKIRIKPGKGEFVVHISADNRYKLFVNGKYICNGPSRGDFLKWKFETVDIMPYLKEGENIIAAVVWNFAEYRPVAQFSNRTGFILQGDQETENIVNSNETWKVYNDTAYSPLTIDLHQYYVVGPGEIFNMQYHPWKWTDLNYDDSNWSSAKELDAGTPLKSFREFGTTSNYILVPRKIPFMEEKPQRFSQIRRSNIDIPAAFINGTKALTIPPNSNATILLDQKHLTDAYPVLSVSGGNNSEITLTYAESLFNDKMEKGDRNDIKDKKIYGNQDKIISDGGENRIFQTLWWRTFRYIQIEIKTNNEPLTINDFHSIYTGYPFEKKASFKSSDSTLADIWNVGWRTQRLCTGETFFDCPYYEQLQYEGDTKIQCLTSGYVSGDTVMMRNAIQIFYDSRLPYGLTQSRYPSYETQVIPPFSLIWITMVHDYWMLYNNPGFVKSMIPGILEVLNWYNSKIDSGGLIGHMEWWNFVDWVDFNGWHNGVPPGIDSSNSSIVNMQYVYTLQKAAQILKAFDLPEQAEEYLQQAERIKSIVYNKCFDAREGLLADTPEKKNFSQHANIWGILTNAFPVDSQAGVLNRILNKKDIAQSSYYFKFYLFKALEKAGMADKFLILLKPWRQMLDTGLTTFAEKPDPTRSDCHAWSASPVYYFLSLVCGIKPNEPGFKTVRIEPHFGNLSWIDGSMPHRSGNIKVKLKKNNGSISGEVILPQNLTGIFIWENKITPLKSGKNNIQTRSKN